jgi:hypothetical protein
MLLLLLEMSSCAYLLLLMLLLLLEMSSCAYLLLLMLLLLLEVSSSLLDLICVSFHNQVIRPHVFEDSETSKTAAGRAVDVLLSLLPAAARGGR